jgi:hypothetical protein
MVVEMGWIWRVAEVGAQVGSRQTGEDREGEENGGEASLAPPEHTGVDGSGEGIRTPDTRIMIPLL